MESLVINVFNFRDVSKRLILECKNTERLFYSAEKACKAVQKLGSGITSDKEAFYVIGTAIHWIMDCVDRIPENEYRQEDAKRFSGLRYANNCLKHNKTFKEVHEIIGHRYPIEFPTRYGPNYIFDCLDDVERDSRYENQWKNYKSELEGKDIPKFLTETFEIVKTYYKNS